MWISRSYVIMHVTISGHCLQLGILLLHHHRCHHHQSFYEVILSLQQKFLCYCVRECYIHEFGLCRNMMLRIQFCLFSHHWITLLLNWLGVEDLQLDLLLIFSVLGVLPTTWLLVSLCWTATTMWRWYFLLSSLIFLHVFPSIEVHTDPVHFEILYFYNFVKRPIKNLATFCILFTCILLTCIKLVMHKPLNFWFLFPLLNSLVKWWLCNQDGSMRWFWILSFPFRCPWEEHVASFCIFIWFKVFFFLSASSKSIIKKSIQDVYKATKYPKNQKGKKIENGSHHTPKTVL